MQCEVFYGSMCKKIEFYTLYISMMKTQSKYMLLEMDLIKYIFLSTGINEGNASSL